MEVPSRDKEFEEYDEEYGERNERNDSEFENMMLSTYTKTLNDYRQEYAEKTKLRPSDFPTDHFVISDTERERGEKLRSNPATVHNWLYDSAQTELLSNIQRKRYQNAVRLDPFARPPDDRPPAPPASSYAVGRRKTSSAVAVVTSGTGKISVNGQHYVEYFGDMLWCWDVTRPFQVTDSFGDYDVALSVRGGGKSGQAGACRLAIAKALLKQNKLFYHRLIEDYLLKRDNRIVERKHYGRYKARKGFAYVRR